MCKDMLLLQGHALTCFTKLGALESIGDINLTFQMGKDIPMNECI